jgi:hypothetical protein
VEVAFRSANPTSYRARDRNCRGSFCTHVAIGRQRTCHPNTCITRQLTLQPFSAHAASSALPPCMTLHNFPATTFMGCHGSRASQHHASGNPPMGTPPYLWHPPAHSIARTANMLWRLRRNQRSVAAFVCTTLQIGYKLQQSVMQAGLAAKISASAIYWTFTPAFPCTNAVVRAFTLQLVRPNENGRALALAMAHVLDNTRDNRQHEVIGLHLARLLTMLDQYAAHKRGTFCVDSSHF